MKTLIAVISALLIGIALGAFGMRAHDLRKPSNSKLSEAVKRAVAAEKIHRYIGEEQYILASEGVDVLVQLDAGEEYKIKARFARKVADYYLTCHLFEPMSCDEHLLQRIRATSERCPALNAAFVKGD